jgi:ligand-binding sensor domain-containing protein
MKFISQTLSMFFIMQLLVGTSISQQLIFNRVPPPQGKIFSHVTGSVQDAQGYMWFATKKGLFKYDGYRMMSYHHNPKDSSSLKTDALEAICIDSTGIIWIATFGKGLERFDPATGIFNHFQHDDKDPTSLSSDWIPAIRVDKQGTLWVGTGNGLDRYDSLTGGFIHYRNEPNDPASISCNSVVSIYEDREGILWIGTGTVYAGSPEEGGLNKLDRKTGRFIRYVHEPGNNRSLVNNKVRAIFEDSKANFWIGTAGDGLHTMNRATGHFTRHSYSGANPEKLSRPPLRKQPSLDHITFITEDATGTIWIGTLESGFNIYDP